MTRKARKGEWEIIHNDEGLLVTGDRVKAANKVRELVESGVSEYDIYATYDRGENYKQARYHLLLPGQQTKAFEPALRPPTGEQIRAAREGAGLSQRELASALDVTPDRVCHWEKGKCGTKNQEIIEQLWTLVRENVPCQDAQS